MYQHDPFLDDLLRRPMQMANQQDFGDDDFDEDEDDDMFGADLLAAAQQEREDEEREANEFAASLLGQDEEPVVVEEAAPEAPQEPVKLFTRPGIRRNLIGYGLLTLLGVFPLVLLFLFGAAAGGLSPLMVLFAVALVLGLGFSLYNLIYSFQHGYEFTVSYNIRSFFKLWPECTVISVVLIGLSFWNLSQLDNGRPLTLSGKQLAQTQVPGRTLRESVENEEVVYSSFKVAQQGRRHAVAKPAARPVARSRYARRAVTRPVTRMAARPGAAAAHAAPVAAHAAPAVHAAAHTTATPEQATEVSAQSAATTTQTSSADAMMRNANNSIGGAVGVVGAQSDARDQLNQTFEKPMAGAGVGFIGGKRIPAGLLGSDNAMINTFFLGGALCAAFGYALILGLAGAIFGALRKFETPFSQKYVEIINIETGEVTSDLRPIAPVMKPINAVARVLIGLFYGSTLGFLLGFALILPLYLFFRGALMNPAAPAATILQALGLTNLPDLAFSNAVTVGGLMIPLVMLIVAKMSPQGMSVSEELMRQHYEIKPTGRYLSPDQAMGPIGNPNLVSFTGEIPEDELERELSTNRLISEMSQDDDNLTSEIIEEFGREFESVFGIDTRELISQPRGSKQQTVVDRKRMSLALEESFGELGNVPVEISAELGQASLPITEWLNLREGTLVLLDKSANEEIDILFNGVRKGKGKLIVSDNALSVKVSTTNFQGSNGNGKLL
jgi:flagellar motor switch protein FliN/FliY